MKKICSIVFLCQCLCLVLATSNIVAATPNEIPYSGLYYNLAHRPGEWAHNELKSGVELKLEQEYSKIIFQGEFLRLLNETSFGGAMFFPTKDTAVRIGAVAESEDEVGYMGGAIRVDTPVFHGFLLHMLVKACVLGKDKLGVEALIGRYFWGKFYAEAGGSTYTQDGGERDNSMLKFSFGWKVWHNIMPSAELKRTWEKPNSDKTAVSFGIRF